MRPRFIVPIIVVSLVIGFGAGVFVEYLNVNSNLPPPIGNILLGQDAGKPNEINFSMFWDVWNALDAMYVNSEEIDHADAIYGAIAGMVNSIEDPYTIFFEPPENKKFQEEISGEFGGVGMEIGIRDDTLTVIAPLKDTPAYHAGIKSGDLVLMVDGESTDGMSLQDAVGRIRGKKGTKVILTISSEGAELSETRDVEIVRSTIKVPTVETKMVGDGVAYIAVYSFNQTVNSAFRSAAKEVLRSEADYLVVDLRNNPGGLLDSAIELAGWFLDKDTLVTTEIFGDGTRNEFLTDGNASLKPLKTVVLINGGSASASEILAGALQDNRGIPLVGQKSFGKGSVQNIREFRDGSSLKVTIAEWHTPAGISISKSGLEPTEEVIIDAELISEGDIEFGEPGKDPQLDRAIEIVTGL